MKKQITIENLIPEVGASTFTISSIEQLESLNFSITQLAEAYNKITGSNIKKFSDKKTALKRTFEVLPEAPAENKNARGNRDLVREFLTVGKIFTVADIAKLLATDAKNANTTFQLLKSRPGKSHQALVVEKVEGQKATYKVIQAPTRLIG